MDPVEFDMYALALKMSRKESPAPVPVVSNVDEINSEVDRIVSKCVAQVLEKVEEINREKFKELDRTVRHLQYQIEDLHRKQSTMDTELKVRIESLERQLQQVQMNDVKW